MTQNESDRANDGGLGLRLSLALGMARAAIALERAWPLVAPLLLGAGLFAALSMTGVFSILPGWLHLFVLCGLIGAAGHWLWRQRRLLRWPTAAAGLRRLEKDNRLIHQPLEILSDQPAGETSPRGRALWAAEILRRKAALAPVHPVRPRPARPPWMPRHALVVTAGIFVLCLLVAGDKAGGRLWAALTPDIFRPGPPPVLQAWIDPPPYTGLAPYYLVKAAAPQAQDDDATQTLRVPQGSIIRARVEGAAEYPTVRVDGGGMKGSRREVAFKRDGPGLYEIEIPIDRGHRLAIRADGDELAAWPIEIIEDRPPDIAFAAAPRGTARLSLEVRFTVRDDYGVTGARLILSRPEATANAAGLPPESIDLALPGEAPRTYEGVAYPDLTAHPLAGLMVEAQLEATDAAAQTSRSAAELVMLPSRTFTHPVAQELIALRRSLYSEPPMAPQIGRALAAIAQLPERYDGDKTVYLGLRYTAGRLRSGAPDQALIHDSGELLWDIAIHLEEGELSVHENDLRAAIGRLQEAIDSDAPAQELLSLTAQLQTALGQYLRSVAQRAAQQRSARDWSNVTRSITASNLMDMIRNIQSLTELGAKDAARQELSRLQQLLENLALPGSGAAAQLQQAMKELDELVTRQRLMASAAEQALEEAPKEDLRNDLLARRQREILDRVAAWRGRLQSSLGQAPEPVNRSMSQMDDSAGALDDRSLPQAAESARAAAQSLQEGRAALDELLDQIASGGGAGGGVDPLGRPLTGSGADVAVPREFDVKRAREILEEIQRRAADWQRPDFERDYLKRLLDRF